MEEVNGVNEAIFIKLRNFIQKRLGLVNRTPTECVANAWKAWSIVQLLLKSENYL